MQKEVSGRQRDTQGPARNTGKLFLVLLVTVKLSQIFQDREGPSQTQPSDVTSKYAQTQALARDKREKGHGTVQYTVLKNGRSFASRYDKAYSDESFGGGTFIGVGATKNIFLHTTEKRVGSFVRAAV